MGGSTEKGKKREQSWPWGGKIGCISSLDREESSWTNRRKNIVVRSQKKKGETWRRPTRFQKEGAKEKQAA